MQLEGNIKKNRIGNIRKSIGARVAKMLFGDSNSGGPMPEYLLNTYSLIGPEYINNKYFPIGIKEDNGVWHGNYGIIGALDNYKKRVGADNRIVGELMKRFNSINGVGLEPEGGWDINEDDIRNIGQQGIDFNWYPNRYQEQYRNIIQQLTPYVDYNNGVVGLRGTYNNTLPGWMQKFTHPLQMDIRY